MINLNFGTSPKLGNKYTDKIKHSCRYTTRDNLKSTGMMVPAKITGLAFKSKAWTVMLTGNDVYILPDGKYDGIGKAKRHAISRGTPNRKGKLCTQVYKGHVFIATNNDIIDEIIYKIEAKPENI